VNTPLEDPVVKADISLIVKTLEEKDCANFFENKTVLITGVAGFLGSWLADTLAALDSKVIGVDNLATGSLNNINHLLKSNNFKFIKADVTKLEPPKEKLDIVLHLAARPSPDDYFKHPVETLLTSSEGTLKALEIARRNDAVFLFTSTSEVYGDAEVIPTPETYWGKVNPVGPRSCYDEGKRYAEALCIAYLRQYGLDIRISRIFNTYGPRLDWRNPGYGRVVVKFIVQALKGEPITVHGDGLQTRSFCYVSDNIEAHLLFLAKKELKGEILNIGNPEEVTILDLAKTVIELTGSKSKIVHTPPRPDDPRRRKPDITKAVKLLDWKPKISLREGLAKTIEWIKPRL